MNLDYWVEKLVEQWAVVKAAPLPFGIARFFHPFLSAPLSFGFSYGSIEKG